MKVKYLFLFSVIILPLNITSYIAELFNYHISFHLTEKDNLILSFWLGSIIISFFILLFKLLQHAYPKSKLHFFLLFFLSVFYYWFYCLKYYNKQLEESKKPPENISKHLKQAFILSLPVLIIGVIELFGIDVHDFIAVLSMIFLIFPTFYLWYYMLVDVYEKNKLHFVFMYLCFPYIWIYYIFFYEKGFNLINKIKNKKRYKR